MIVDVLGKFSRDAVATMNGQVTSTPSRLRSFRSDFKKLYEQFAACIAYGKPKFSIQHPSDREREKIDRIEIDLLSDESDDDEEPITDHRKNNKRGPPETPSKAKRQKTEDGFLVLGTPPPRLPSTPSTNHTVKHELPLSTLATRKKPAPFAGTIFEEFSAMGSGFGSLATIKEEIKTYSISGLSETINEETYSELCLRSVKPWNRPAEAFVEKAISMVRNHLEKILDQHLRVHAQTYLPATAKKALREFVDACAQKQREAVRAEYEDLDVILTTGNELLRYFRSKEFDDLTAKRKLYLLNLEVDHQCRVNPKKRPDPSLSPEERSKAMDKLRADVKEDELLKRKLTAYDKELDVMAMVRAYYILASVRFTDKVVVKMNSVFFKGIKEGITSYIEEKIGVNSGDGTLFAFPSSRTILTTSQESWFVASF
jgi:hypothetical protein